MVMSLLTQREGQKSPNLEKCQEDRKKTIFQPGIGSSKKPATTNMGEAHEPR
jgi:hypothetical protein